VSKDDLHGSLEWGEGPLGSAPFITVVQTPTSEIATILPIDCTGRGSGESLSKDR